MNENLPSLPPLTPSGSGLVDFANALDIASNFAKQKRNALSLDFMTPGQGIAPASDFSSILSRFNAASDDTAEKLIENASGAAEPDLLTVDEAKKLGVPFGTTKSQAAAMGVTPSDSDPGALFDRTSGLRKEFNGLRTSSQLDDVRFAYSAISEGVRGIDTGTSTPGIADQAIIRGFVRMTDPGSVVREGEFAISTQGQSLINQLRGRVEAAAQGGVGLTAEERSAIKELSTQLYADYVRRYNTEAAKYRQYAKQGGVNADEVATYQETVGLIDPYTAREGDILILKGKPYRKTSTGFEAVETDSEAVSASGNRPQRNNNPLNIKASEYTLVYPGVTGTDPVPATDGGKFLTFASPEDGFAAAKRLIKTEGYKNLTVDAAMKRWSGNGYGGEIAPRLSAKKIADLTPDELDTLIESMAKHEGYYA